MGRPRPETAVVSHPNADLDALGSMVAATYLYPDAVPVFPHGAETAVHDLLRELGEAAPVIREAGDVAVDGLRRLVVVDNADLTRIGPFEEPARAGAAVAIHDHHGGGYADLPEHAEVHAGEAGANTTLMVAALRARELVPGPAAATIMAAGVYEDTGMLTHPEVTAEDFAAAAWLAACGADLPRVGRILRRELNPDQVHLFDRILRAARPEPHLRQRIYLACVPEAGEVAEAAEVVQRVRDSLDAPGLIALIQQDSRIAVIARSGADGPDMGTVLAEIGGGGHPHAASASLGGVPMAEAVERVRAAVADHYGTHRRAGDLATRPVHSLAASLSVAEAGERLRRYPLNRMPVVDASERPVGWVDPSLLARALDHGLGGRPVADYAAALPTLPPDADLHDAEVRILDQDQPMVGIVTGERLDAVLTRTDLIRHWRAQSDPMPEPGAAPGSGSRRNLAGRLRESLPPSVEEALEILGAVAAERGVRAFLVGGLVRDLILRRPNADVDVVVEGDAIALARAFAERTGWYAHPHEQFRTAAVVGPDGAHVDLATARIEHYPQPGALPEVEVGSIRADLYRRDFTINALALELDGDRFGQMLDPYGGLNDIRADLVRVLHSLSFVEDPTRILRAVRFEVELGFRIEPQTERLIGNAVELDMPARLTGHRLFRELRALLEAVRAPSGVARLRGLGMLPYIHSGLAGEGGQGAVARVEAGGEVLEWHALLYRDEAPCRWQVLALLLLWEQAPGSLRATLRDWEVRSRDARRLESDRRRADEVAGAIRSRRIPEGDDVALFEALAPFGLEGLLALMAATPDERVRRRISHYLQHLRGTAPALDGAALKALGVPEGPAIGRWLQDLTRARIRGEAHSADEERARVRAQLSA